MWTFGEIRKWKRDDRDAYVSPTGVTIYVADNAIVGDCAIVGVGASVGDRARVGDRAFVGAGAIVGDRASVGDGARVGVDAIVGDGARVKANTTFKGEMKS